MTHREAMEWIQKAGSVPELVHMLQQHHAQPVLFNWAMKYFLDVRARESGTPLKGMFELTPFCNLDCRMCYVHLNAAQMKGKQLLPASQWERIMDEAIDAGMMYASLTGGECLTYPEFDRLYLHLQERGVQVGILTNAVLLDEARIAFFRQHAPSSVQVTLYGCDEEMYERVTGRKEFSRVVANLKAADAAGLPLVLTLTPNPYMLPGDDEKLVRFAAGLGLPFHVNSSLIDPREQTGRSKTFCDLGVEDYVRLFRLELELKGSLPPTECQLDLPESAAGPIGEAPRGLRCGGGRSSFNVSWEGRLSPCNRLRTIVSDPLQIGFQKAWEQVHSGAMAYVLPAQCETCAYRKAAKACAAAHENVPAGQADPAECRWCHAMVRAGLAKL